MRRLFPIVAISVGLLIMAGFFLGLVGWVDQLARSVRFAAVASTLGGHALACASLWASGRRVEALARRASQPEWVEALAEKNRRKALLCASSGSLIAILATGSRVGDWWFPIVSGSNVSIQVGAFLGEAAIVANQSKLLGDLDRLAVEGQLLVGPQSIRPD